MFNFNLGPIIFLGIFGAIVLILLIIIGIPWLIWYLIQHLTWV